MTLSKGSAVSYMDKKKLEICLQSMWMRITDCNKQASLK